MILMAQTLSPRRVSRNVGLNPVAVAYAKKTITESVLTEQIRVYLLEDGDDYAAEIQNIGFFLAVVTQACSTKPAKETAIVRGALSSLAQMSVDGKWRKSQTVAICEGIKQAKQLFDDIKPRLLNHAINTVLSLHPKP